MDEIDIYRGSGIFKKAGDWWSPSLKHAEVYRDRYGPLGLKGKMSKSKISIDDFKKGVLTANETHRKNRQKLQKLYPNEFGKTERLTNSKLSKQFDSDLKNLTPERFKAKYYEGVLPNQPAKLAFLNSLKPVAKVAGPLGLAYGAYDYLSGTPTGDATINSNIKMVEEPNAFETWYKKIF